MDRVEQLEAENARLREALVAISTGCTGRDTDASEYADIVLETCTAVQGANKASDLAEQYFNTLKTYHKDLATLMEELNKLRQKPEANEEILAVSRAASELMEAINELVTKNNPQVPNV